MPRSSETALIVGAGLQGCAIAIFLARAGWKVSVIEKNVAGRHASGVNAGGLRLLMRDWQEYPLSELALAHWSNLGELVGEAAAESCEVRLGTSQVAAAMDQAELTWAEARASDMKRRGLGKEELLSQEELRRLVPAISTAALGGLISRRDGHANPAAAARAFREAAIAAGATIVENCRVLGLSPIAGGGWRVESSTGRFECGVLVNCAGAWGSQVAALADEPLPEKVTAPSMMVTARVKPFVTPVVIGIDRPLSFKQSAAGSLVIGGGILGDARPDQDTSFTMMDRMAQGAAAAIEVFPALAQIPILRTWTGLEGRTPDGLPIIGESAKHPNLWHAFGFCGHGFLLAPAVGDVVARSLIEGRADTRIAHFSPRRFAPASDQPAGNTNEAAQTRSQQRRK
jgi:sarcosine oxidase, subunit beta